MDATTLLWTAFFSFLPISELRGAIPFAIARGMDWRWAYLYSVGLNALVAPACWIFLSTFHKLFLKMGWYRSFFDGFVERARIKIHSEVERWGWLGIAVFVAIPLPVTGAWTGTLGAWVLGMGKRKTMLAVVIGVAGAGVIVTAVTVLGIRALDLFVKRV
ncbi:MAG TPA: ligand-binding protein SH3 [Treponema sp.]|nr:MAG: ligand-binding protein SH3 [Treponema sp. GWC1_61_84]OHE75560.1 MAG: ligand-binding protein SH3 [Treponema sp. RIFOXYC1_FULL_61_9]HCM25480.1 ligand-binding protein SH3 [Treponema sp.]